jgi:hypothetical protein
MASEELLLLCVIINMTKNLDVGRDGRRAARTPPSILPLSVKLGSSCKDRGVAILSL